MSWLCAWCETNGKFPVSECWRPDSEEPVKTLEGEDICQACAKAYREGRQKQLKEIKK